MQCTKRKAANCIVCIGCIILLSNNITGGTNIARYVRENAYVQLPIYTSLYQNAHIIGCSVIAGYMFYACGAFNHEHEVSNIMLGSLGCVVTHVCSYIIWGPPHYVGSVRYTPITSRSSAPTRTQQLWEYQCTRVHPHGYESLPIRSRNTIRKDAPDAIWMQYEMAPAIIERDYYEI